MIEFWVALAIAALSLAFAAYRDYEWRQQWKRTGVVIEHWRESINFNTEQHRTYMGLLSDITKAVERANLTKKQMEDDEVRQALEEAVRLHGMSAYPEKAGTHVRFCSSETAVNRSFHKCQDFPALAKYLKETQNDSKTSV